MRGARVVSTPRGALPRVVTPSLLWTGGCLPLNYHGEIVHGHFCNYVVRGSKKTMMIDTGHPAHWPGIENDVETFLEGRPVDYIFITHGELPHAGLVTQWFEKYPGAIAFGDISEYPLYYPEYAHRFRDVKAGDGVDLGDRRVVFTPAIWRDLATTLWAFDTKDRVLFVSDAYGYLHFHKRGDCDCTTSEMPAPDAAMMRFLNERAMLWTLYGDARATFADLDEMLERLKPRLVAAAHGGVIDDPQAMTPLIKDGMILSTPHAN